MNGIEAEPSPCFHRFHLPPVAFEDAEVMAAVGEVAKDPNKMLKYKDNKKVDLPLQKLRGSIPQSTLCEAEWPSFSCLARGYRYKIFIVRWRSSRVAS